jgi:phosphatidate cytidylyltransferase
MALAGITSLLWFLIRAEEQARPVANLGMTVLPVAYVGVLAGFGGLILGFPNGIGILLGAVIPTVAHDVMGFAVGSRLGTHRIAPEVSPNKTAEGLIGAVLGAIVAALIFVRPIHPWSTGSAFWLGVVVAVMAPIGDLVESMLKRDIGVKDFSSLIPGHGGLLDRFDSILFVLPGVFYLVRILDLF